MATCGGKALAVLAATLIASPASPLHGQAEQISGGDGEVASRAQIRIVPRCSSQASSSDEILVCGRRSETERQRLNTIIDDRFDPGGTVESVSRERHRLYEVGESGIGSCSPSGPGGVEGCSFRRFKQMLEQYGK
jgi:hypothetical protein